jgi:hypothetical protein
MASNWPDSIDNFGTVTGTESTNHPNAAGLTHAGVHNLLADAVTKLETQLQNVVAATPNSGGTQLSFFPANPAGLTTLVETPDPVSGTGSRTDLVLAGDQSLLSVKISGDTYPRWLLNSDPTDGLYFADGTIDPYGSGANIWYTGNGTNGRLSLYGPSGIEFRMENVGGPFSQSHLISGGWVAAQSTDQPILQFQQNASGTFSTFGLYGHSLHNTPNGYVYAREAGDLCIIDGLLGATPGLWQATTAGISNWVQIGSGGTSLYGETSISQNTALGYGALGITTIGGSDNGSLSSVAVGVTALYATTGVNYNNVAVGYAAGNALIGHSSVAVGTDALSSTTGSQNIGIGDFAGTCANGFILTGSDNVSIGYRASSGNVSANTTSSNNIAIGTESLTLAHGATDNVAIGYRSIYDSATPATGQYNVAIGSLAGQGLYAGTHNTYIGYNAASAGYAGHSSDQSNVIGIGALAGGIGVGSIAIGNFGSVIGLRAIGIGYSITQTGDSSILIGGDGVVSGIGSIAIGDSVSGSGQSSISIGQGSGSGANYAITIGTSATANGVASIAIGQNSGGTGTNGVWLGLDAGGTGNNSVAIGYGATTNADGAVAIGVDHTGTAASSATQDLIVLGTSNHTVNVPGSLTVQGVAVGNPSYFPANATGFTTTTTTPDPISGANSRKNLEVAANQSILSVQISGDSYPRWVLGSDPHSGGLWAGDGTFEPFNNGAFLYYDPSLKCYTFGGGGTIGPDVVLGSTSFTSVGNHNPNSYITPITAGELAISVAFGSTVQTGLWISTSSSNTSWNQLATVQEYVNTVASSGATQTIPDPFLETINNITLTANCTLTFPTAVAGKSFLLGLLQDATGSRTVTWPGTVKWAGGTAPTLTTTASKLDMFSFVCLDGTNWLGVVAGENF